MNNNVLITLGVPVYNGENSIDETLSSIYRALNRVNSANEFEVLISDNCSTDNTEKLIRRRQELGFKISYYRNDINVGYDKNIDEVVERSKGKYVWFIGCGEILEETAILRLYEKLKSNVQYSNILLDFDIYDEVKGTIVNDSVLDFKGEITLKGKNDFRYIKYGPAVSSNIVNRNKWMEVNDLDLRVDGWCHIERILSLIALDDDSISLLISSPFFTLVREKDGWWTNPSTCLLHNLILHLYVIESMLEKGFSKDVIYKLKSKQARAVLISAILQSKAVGFKININVINDLFFLFRKDYFFWICVIPTLIMPNTLSFIPRAISKLVRMIHKSIK